MGTAEYVAIALGVLSMLFGVIGWLLSSKDKKQEEQISDLYTVHREDADRLTALQIQIASNHYQKNELDHKIEKLEQSINVGFDKLGNELKDLAAAVNDRRNGERTGSYTQRGD